jgi:hypothetical protein
MMAKITSAMMAPMRRNSRSSDFMRGILHREARAAWRWCMAPATMELAFELAVALSLLLAIIQAPA